MGEGFDIKKFFAGSDGKKKLAIVVLLLIGVGVTLLTPKSEDDKNAGKVADGRDTTVSVNVAEDGTREGYKPYYTRTHQELLEVPTAEDNENMRASTMATLEANKNKADVDVDPMEDFAPRRRGAGSVSDKTADQMKEVKGVTIVKEEPRTPVNPNGSSTRKSTSRSGGTSSRTKSATTMTSQQTVTASASEKETDPAASSRRRDGTRVGDEQPQEKQESLSLGDGFSSLDYDNQPATISDDHLYKVRFTRDQKVTSGERISIRLLEDLTLDDGVVIPRNSHLSATLTIGERLDIRVSSIEINGKAHNIRYSAVDVDGGAGLYCPQTQSQQTARTAKNELGNIGSSALSSKTSGLSNTIGQIVRSGANLVVSSGGKQTVVLTSGYEFFLKKDKRR